MMSNFEKSSFWKKGTYFFRPNFGFLGPKNENIQILMYGTEAHQVVPITSFCDQNSRS